MEALKRIPAYFTRDFQDWETFELFKNTLYVFLFVNTLILMPIATEMYDFHGMADFRPWNLEIPWYKQFSFAITNILSHPATNTRPWIIWFFIGGQLLFLALGFFNRIPRISAVMIYFFTANLFLKGSMMLTGGEVLIYILLVYMAFIQFTSRKLKEGGAELSFSPIQNLLNNTFFLACKIQVCYLYFFSTVYKLYDEHWIGGDALMYVSRIEHYQNAPFAFVFSDNPTVAMIATYFALAYQLCFPVLVWTNKLKTPLLIVGVIFHLGIAFGMGIFGFGIIMCLTYLMFLNKSHTLWIRKKLRMPPVKSSSV
ncbi:MAG: HTTM domain-containing protein [Crocinitomicaceae bacterium]|nr:HTTM domain-containing protein [Crocinitomicaceae bacterium]